MYEGLGTLLKKKNSCVMEYDCYKLLQYRYSEQDPVVRASNATCMEAEKGGPTSGHIGRADVGKYPSRLP